MRVGAPERRHASSSSHVPSTFARNVPIGLRNACSTIVCAARWKTASTSYSTSTRWIVAPSRTSPETWTQRSAAPLVKTRASGTRSRTRSTTRAPRSSSAATSQEPSSPVPPVTRTGRPAQPSAVTTYPGSRLRAPPSRAPDCRRGGGGQRGRGGVDAGDRDERVVRQPLAEAGEDLGGVRDGEDDDRRRSRRLELLRRADPQRRPGEVAAVQEAVAVVERAEPALELGR